MSARARLRRSPEYRALSRRPVVADSTPLTSQTQTIGVQFLFERPLKALWRSRLSDVISRKSTSATNLGKTQVAFGFLIGLVSLDFGLTTVSSRFRIWPEMVPDHPVPTFPI
jgi:hypothetical protein